MVTSQNGWPASANRAEIDVQPFALGSVQFPGGVRAGGVAAVLGYVAAEFHGRVEPLVEGWCWGHNFRQVAGSSVVSNHGSGTAIDVNAPRHPLGSAGTFTAAQKREIRKIMKEVDGVVRWGGEYAGRKDEMHFEINGNQADVDRVAAVLQNREDETMGQLDDTIRDIAYRVLDELQGHELQTGGPGKGTELGQVRDINAMKWRVHALVTGLEYVADGPTKDEPVAVVMLLNKILAKLEES
jgi:hypothetical protein